MKIVFISHTFYNPYFVVSSHHLARQLARRGHTVWHISPIPFFHLANPFIRDYWTRFRRFFKGSITLETGLNEAVIRPLLPWQVTRRVKAGNFFIRSSCIQLLVKSHRELQNVDVLMIDEPRLVGVQNYIHSSSAYYRPTDLYAEMKKDVTIIAAESTLVDFCDGLIATSQPVMKHALSLKKSIPHLLLTNGADLDHFSTSGQEPPALEGILHPRVIYAGAIDQRFDLEVVRKLSLRFPSVSFILIGGGSKYREALAHPIRNLHVLGYVPYSNLNVYLRHADIALLPLLDNEINDGRSPMKLYEYGMSGLPVLARWTSELDRRKESFVQLYSNDEEAAEGLAALLSTSRDRRLIAAECTRHSWSEKAAILEKFIEETRFKSIADSISTRLQNTFPD